MPEGTMAINLENAYPMTNEEGLEQTSYEFKIINDGTINKTDDLNIYSLSHIFG